MTLPTPPGSSSALAAFPSVILRSSQPLSRIHRETNATQWFSNDQTGRFDPPHGVEDFGTCYFSTHPVGAFVETFGRINPISRQNIDERVLATSYLASDVILANALDPHLIGQWGLTGELSTSADYDPPQQWANAWFEAGFSGVIYAARHDPSLQSRSIAIFGKPGYQPTAFFASTTAIPYWVESEAKRRFGFKIIPRTALN